MKKIFVAALLLVSVVVGVMAQIEPIDEKTAWITSIGYGNKAEDTKLDAAMNAVQKYVEDLLTMQDEKQKFQQNKKVFLAQATKYIYEYSIKTNVEAKGKLPDGRSYKRTMTFKMKVNTEEIRKDLETMGIIASSKDLQKQLDNFTIMAFVDEKKSDQTFMQFKDIAETKISSYLQNQHIPTVNADEIKEVEGKRELINLMKSTVADTGEEDPILQLSRMTNADIYVKVIGRLEEMRVEGQLAYKATITINAYAVMTAEQIASQTGYSKPMSLSSKSVSVSAAIEESINSAMSDIMNKLRLFWKDYAADGKPYVIVLTDYPFAEQGQIRTVLKEISENRIKLGKKAGNNTSFTIWYKGQIDDLVFDLPGRIEMNLKEDPSILGNTVFFFRQK